MIGKIALIAAAGSALLAAPAAAQAGAIGTDAAACNSDNGPAIRVNVEGLKDRTGRLKLELYPADADDFLKDDHDLEREGKVFRRVWAKTPQSGPVTMCIKVPHPGTYALFFTHDRDGRNKFNIWKDGAGIPSNEKLGRSKPKVGEAEVTVGDGVVTKDIRAQYMRGIFSGFGPLKN